MTSRRVALATVSEEGQGARGRPGSGAMEAAAGPAAPSGAVVPAAAVGAAVATGKGATGKGATSPAARRPKKILDEEAYIEVGWRAWAWASPGSQAGRLPPRIAPARVRPRPLPAGTPAAGRA